MSYVSALRIQFVLSTFAALVASTKVEAACSPNSPINNAIVVCTGSTINQNGTAGYGTASDTGNTINVQASAFVLGSANGLILNSGTINNFGGVFGGTSALTQTATGIFGQTITINNSGDILGAINGIGVIVPSLTLNNTGEINGGAAAINSVNATINNSGNLGGGKSGVVTSATASILNSGQIVANGTALSANSAYVVNSGNISGTIGIDATSASIITNSGTISGSTGIAINFHSPGNILTLEPGSSISGSARGLGADTFQLGGIGSGAFDAGLLATQLSGYATFNKVGSSVWTVTGTNSAGMSWAVSEGGLVVNGFLPHGTFQVNTGGVLGGNGTIGNATIAGGVLAPDNSFGLLSITGNLTFNSSSLYVVEISPTNANRTNVAGQATLGGAAVNASYAPGSFISKQYTILSATGGISGTFGSLLNTNLPANFKASLSYDANDAYLNLALNFTPLGPTPPSFGSGLSANQQAVGNALINSFNTNGGIPMVYGTLTPADLTQASGEVATASQQTTFDAMSQFMGLLTDPFMGRGNGINGSASATGYADGSDQAHAYAANGMTTDAFAMFSKAPSLAPFVQRWSVWASSFGGAQSTSGNAIVGSNDSASRIAGTAVGADYLFSPNTLGGFAFAGGGTSFGINNLGGGRSDLFQAGAYIRQADGPAYIAGALAYGWQDIITNRTLTIAGFDQLRAEFNANAYSARAEGGYRFVAPIIGGVGITPYAADQFAVFELPNYMEQAFVGTNSFVLSYNAKGITDSRSELGVRADKSWSISNGVLTLRSQFAWAHDFNPDRAISATFQTLPSASFVVNGAAMAADSALTMASAQMTWMNGWSAAATFEGGFSNVTRSYAGKGIVRYAW